MAATQSYSTRAAADVEKGGSMHDFAERTVRLGFVRKVMGLLAAQLLLTTVIGAAFVSSPAIKGFVASNPWVLMLSLVVAFGIILTFTFSKAARQSHPLNLGLLFAFTSAEGVLVGAASATVSTDIVVLAFGLTAGLTAGLALYALTTKTDFTTAGAFLYSMLMVLIMASFVGFFVKTTAFNILVSSLGAIVFSVYIVHDIQMLMGGDHKYQLSPDEYVFGAISIYLDVLNLFLSILRILSESNRN